MRRTARRAARLSAANSINIVRASAVLTAGLASLSAGKAAASGWHLAPWHEDGQASYYGRHWNGHRTSSGAVFDPLKLTAAHASLPLGTRLLVTSEESGESVVVTVNDRQPDHGRRIIDLSPAAARRLHMMGGGVAEVVITEATEDDLRNQQANDEEVAEAPDDAEDAAVAATSGRHGPRHRRHARR